MKYILLLFIMTGLTMKAQTHSFVYDLYSSYGEFYERSITTNKFPPESYNLLMHQFAASGLLEEQKLGTSINGREVSLYKWGKGEIKIFLWSQMHGDESTASLAILDILNFLKDSSSLSAEKQKLSSAVTLYLLPLVNPDGADAFTRRNSISIDLNRDALRQTTPEAKILMDTFLKLQPHYAFNLHDQNPRYSAGNSPNIVAISFLAPAPDLEKTITPNRLQAMKVISGMTETMNKFVPGHTAKYDDAFEPRAFGDNFQKLGAATILIESGGWRDDAEKQFIRKLNYLILLDAFFRISQGGVELLTTELYDDLPFNDTRLYDVIFRNCTYTVDGKSYLVDVAVNRSETIQPDGKIYGYAEIEEIGDLSVFYGLDEYDFSGLEIVSGELPEKSYTINELTTEVLNTLHNQGIHSVKLSNNKFAGKFSKLPLNLILNSGYVLPDRLLLNRNASFVVKKDSKPHYLVVNGYLHYPSAGAGFIRNGIVIK